MNNESPFTYIQLSKGLTRFRKNRITDPKHWEEKAYTQLLTFLGLSDTFVALLMKHGPIVDEDIPGNCTFASPLYGGQFAIGYGDTIRHKAVSKPEVWTELKRISRWRHQSIKAMNFYRELTLYFLCQHHLPDLSWYDATTSSTLELPKSAHILMNGRHHFASIDHTNKMPKWSIMWEHHEPRSVSVNLDSV